MPTGFFSNSFEKGRKKLPYRLFFLSRMFFVFLVQLFPCTSVFSQTIHFSYSYFNITRNNGGGTLQPGDTIEVRALGYVDNGASISRFRFIDTIRTGTQYIPNSLKMVSNEGISYLTFTDASNDDGGVYDAAAPGVRVNVGSGTGNAQSGINFLSTSGGGNVNGGDIPIAGPGTLGIVAYRLKITASFGDTIRIGGNFYYRESGNNYSHHFSGTPIKITQNLGLCTDFSSASFSAESSFSNGLIQNRLAGILAPGYIKDNITSNTPHDNYYSVVNNSSGDGTTDNSGPFKPNVHRVFGAWDIIGDHTNATNTAVGNAPVSPGTSGGYMLLVNADYNTGLCYLDTITNLCPNTYYEFSAWIRNLCGQCGADMAGNPTGPGKHGVLPNLTYNINGVDYYSTGNIQYSGTWVKRGFLYKTGPSETGFVMGIKNNASGGDGNDWVLDDINLSTCYPNLTMNPNDTAKICAGGIVNLFDTVRSYFNDYTYYCWEKSTDGGITWISTGNCGSKVPVLTNGLYEYIVDTAFITVAADSGTYYRVRVATTFANLSGADCSVINSQKVFMKVYDYDCSVLNGVLKDFSGRTENELTILSWSTLNEASVKNFEVQRSVDGAHFSTIKVISPLYKTGGAYLVYDNERITGNVFYRISVKGQSESQTKYSSVISLFQPNSSFDVKVVNPFVNNLKMRVASPTPGVLETRLYDSFGRTVRKNSHQVTRGNNLLTIEDVSPLKSGVYILSGSMNGYTFQQKIMKIH